jgi:hypothetical protein
MKGGMKTQLLAFITSVGENVEQWDGEGCQVSVNILSDGQGSFVIWAPLATDMVAGPLTATFEKVIGRHSSRFREA